MIEPLPQGELRLQFHEEPDEQDWYALLWFVRNTKVYEGREAGLEVTVIPRGQREEVREQHDLVRVPVMVTRISGFLVMHWDADGHIEEREVDEMSDDESD